MNRYGQRVKTHYQRFLPTRYAQIPDPETHFSMLGSQIEDEISATEEQMVGSDPAGEDYLIKVGRLNMARMRAEELVLAQFLPDPGLADDLDDPNDNPAAAQVLAWSRKDQQQRTEQAQAAQQEMDRPVWQAHTN